MQACAHAKSVSRTKESPLRLQPIKRTKPAKSGDINGIEINLPFKSPYNWQTLIRFYQTHPIPGLERVTASSFERVFCIENRTGVVRVETRAGPQLKVRISPVEPEIRLEVVRRVGNMFDLACDPMAIERSFRRIPLLASLCRRYPGLRLPRGWDPFETAICAILGQLVSASQRANLIGQLVHNYGDSDLAPIVGRKAALVPRRGGLGKR